MFLTILILHLLHPGSGILSQGPNHGVYPVYSLADSGQLLTSSTLNWVDMKLVESGKIAADKVVVWGSSAVCRYKFGDRLDPGTADYSGNCVVRGVKHKEYQVLVDTWSMARISWSRWTMFKTPLIGSVAFNEKTFVGLLSAESNYDREERIIAELDYNRGLNGEVVLQMSEEKTKTDTEGWVLVETEPIKYSLEDVKIHTQKIVSEETVDLGHVHLHREEGFKWEDDWETVEKDLKYKWTGYEFWGSVGGLVKGLATYIHLADAEHLSDVESQKYIKWGLHSTSDKVEKLRVAYDLQPGTEVNVTISGSKARVDSFYTCVLHSVFRDGSLNTHNISSVLSRDILVNITHSISGPLFSDSGLPAPTTTSTTTTTTSTTVSPDTTPPPHAHMFRAEKPTSTLFPPALPPVTRPNPLKQFYPDTDDTSEDFDQPQNIVRLDILPLSGSQSIIYSEVTITLGVFINLIIVNQSLL